MKLLKKIFKRTFLFIGLLLALIILAGLVFRLFGPERQQPPGRLVAVNDVQMHIHASGKKSNAPTLVIESGAGLSSAYYHWLNEGLKDSMRVVRYDRSGNGYSESHDTPRTTEVIAKELHALLEAAGESPPYILAGHSLGGPYIRVFAQLYPDEVEGLVLIDATHPEQVERFDAAPASSFRFKSVIWALNIGVFFGDMGVLGLVESFTDPIFAGDGLPEAINARTKDFLLDGKCLRAYKAELKNYHVGLKRAKEANNFGSMPIRVFTAVEMDKEAYRKRGIDPEKHLQELIEGQREFAALSTDGKQFLIDGNHQSIFTKKENANIICNEILQLLK